MPVRNRNIFEYLLYPFSLIYGMVIFIRNRLYDYNLLKVHSFNIPIISVGNITVGGTGKTPHVEYLIRLLKDDFSVATLSRGYKRKTRGFIKATRESTAHEIGDEPRQMKQKFPEIIVSVDENRVRGIKNLLKEKDKLDVIILDDAFQHRRVKPGLSILLTDFNQPITQDHLLPFGRLREQPYEKRRAHIILVTKSPDRIKPIERRLILKELQVFPYQNLYFTSFSYFDPQPVFPDQKVMTKAQMRDEKPRILMLTAIANPRIFKRQVRGISTKITEIKFSDHHDFSDKDLDKVLSAFREIKAENKYILTTEKDAMRLQKFEELNPDHKAVFYYIPLEVTFLNEDTDNFNRHIINYVRDNKRDSILLK